MQEKLDKPVLVALTMLSSICTIVAFFLDHPIISCIMVAITLALLASLRTNAVPARTELQPEFEKPAITTAEQRETLQKKWIDHAYCNGTGSITAFYDGSSHHIETCGICHGHGQILTDLWDQPSCRRCGGSGKLTDTEYVPTVHQVGYSIVQHHQFNKTTKPCDVCGGTGRRPRLPEQSAK